MLRNLLRFWDDVHARSGSSLEARRRDAVPPSMPARVTRAWAVAGLGVGLVTIVGMADVVTGAELSFSIFYLAPVGFSAWHAGRGAGGALSLLAALTWLLADQAAGASYASAWIPVWNALARLSFFAIVTELLVRLRRALSREQQLATTDHLTGVANARALYGVLNAELQRARRHPRPFSVAYADLDNFKAVNDRGGHETGDQVLRFVAETIRTNVRAIDTVARMGGDEFAVLLPETDAEAAQAAFDKVHRLLEERMRERGWPVTFSIGVVTCLRPPSSVDELLRLADDLMYSVKRGSKSAVQYGTFGTDGPGAAALPEDAASDRTSLP